MGYGGYPPGGSWGKKFHQTHPKKPWKLGEGFWEWPEIPTTVYGSDRSCLKTSNVGLFHVFRGYNFIIQPT